MAKLYIVPVANHPIARMNTYWEEKDGYMQQVKMEQQPDGYMTPNGYIGILYPFKDFSDAVVEIRP